MCVYTRCRRMSAWGFSHYCNAIGEFFFFLRETVIVPFILHLSSPRPVVVCVGRSEIELSLSVFPLLLIPDVRRPQYRLVIRRRGWKKIVTHVTVQKRSPYQYHKTFLQQNHLTFIIWNHFDIKLKSSVSKTSIILIEEEKNPYALRLVAEPMGLKKVSVGIVVQPTEGEWSLW